MSATGADDIVRQKLDLLAECIAEWAGVDPEKIQVDYKANQVCFPMNVAVVLAEHAGVSLPTFVLHS